MEIASPNHLFAHITFGAWTDLQSYQFYRVAPDGIAFVATPLKLRSISAQGFEDGIDAVWASVDVVANKRVDAITFGSSRCAASLGRDRVLEVLGEVVDRTGIDGMFDLETAVSVLHDRGCSRVALATFEPAEHAGEVSRYLAHADIDVVRVRSIDRPSRRPGRSTPVHQHQMALELGRSVLRDAPAVDALVFPGNNWFSVFAAPALEAEFGIPVVTDPTASVWQFARVIRPEFSQVLDPKWGRLFSPAS